MLAELKMLRSLQVRVNQRTIIVRQAISRRAGGRHRQRQAELRKLAERQVKIEKATKDIATGKTVGGSRDE